VIRLQHNHGAIFTPRLAYKWKINDNNIVRFNTGTGFRIVNLFTEEHAALGSRVIVLEELKPERSYNAELFEEDVY
jgi:outer membrane receptor for ferrienterochelin and colicins